MTIGLSNGLKAATIALAFGLGASLAARADDLSGPAQAKALLAQGQLNLVQGKAGSAAADLGQAVRLDPTDAYGVLWLHFARTKENAPDALELQTNAGRANRAVWPGPLLDYLTGKIDASAAMARAEEAQGVAKAKAVCEAHLFLGQEDLAKGRRSEGLAKLQAAARACDGATREAKLVLADLDRLGAPKPMLTTVSNAAPKPAPTTATNVAPQPAPQTIASKAIATKTITPKAAPKLAATVLKPASVKPEPQAPA
ncbi:MAG: hypothetical protein ACXU8Z_19385, partial [Caulobacteraceae bacterium]